mmetsp:Transcript_23493/g.51127  ORF Transcript_23493/g.51127 Transcript_23493/m.51127 type:complete len:206 (+) Transcript_23493:305-922(+)
MLQTMAYNKYATPQAKTSQVFRKTYRKLRFCWISFSTASCGCQLGFPFTCAHAPRTKRTTPMISSGLKSRMDKVISTNAKASCRMRTEHRSSFSSSSSSESSESSPSGNTRVGGRVNITCSYSSSEENSPSPILEDLPVQRRYFPRFRDGSLSNIRKPLGMMNSARMVKRNAYMPTTGRICSSRPNFCSAKKEVAIFTSRMPGPA